MNPWPKGWRLPWAIVMVASVTVVGLAVAALPALVAWWLWPWWAGVLATVACTVTAWRPSVRNGTLRLVSRRWSPVTLAVHRFLGAEWAVTIGLVIMSTADVTGPWEDHENRHVSQAMAIGPVILPVWALSGGYFGYTDSILEVDARAHEDHPAAMTTR